MLQRRPFDLPPIPEAEAREAGTQYSDLFDELFLLRGEHVRIDRAKQATELAVVLGRGALALQAKLLRAKVKSGWQETIGFRPYPSSKEPNDISDTICYYAKEGEYTTRDDWDNPLNQGFNPPPDERGAGLDALIASLQASRLERRLGTNHQWIGPEEVAHVRTLLTNGTTIAPGDAW